MLFFARDISLNSEHHAQIDGIINDELLHNLDRIKIYPITIRSEEDLAKEITRIANLSIELGYRLERDALLGSETTKSRFLC